MLILTVPVGPVCTFRIFFPILSGAYAAIGVGKSSLVHRFVTNNFKPYSESTIG